MSLLQKESADISASITVDQHDIEDAPPAYVSVQCSQQDSAGDIPETQCKLPSYELATDLPVYDEFQEMKSSESRHAMHGSLFGSSSANDEFLVDGLAVGTDCCFLFAFLVAFFFNWLGFFAGYCILANHAGRHGAISGFGLSVINWLLYEKYSRQEVQDSHTDERLIFWMILFACGTFLAFKGLYNWSIVRRLREIDPEQAQEGGLVVMY